MKTKTSMENEVMTYNFVKWDPPMKAVTRPYVRFAPGTASIYMGSTFCKEVVKVIKESEPWPHASNSRLFFNVFFDELKRVIAFRFSTKPLEGGFCMSVPSVPSGHSQSMREFRNKYHPSCVGSRIPVKYNEEQDLWISQLNIDGNEIKET